MATRRNAGRVSGDCAAHRRVSTRALCRTGSAAQGWRGVAPRQRVSWRWVATALEVRARSCARAVPDAGAVARWRAETERSDGLGKTPAWRAGQASNRRERVADLLRRERGQAIRQRSRYLSLSGTFSHWAASSGPGFFSTITGHFLASSALI